MRHIAPKLALIAALAVPLAAHAQTETTPEPDDGFSLMEEGMRLMFRGMMQEVEPALRELDGLSEQLEPALRGFLQNMGPALGDFLGQVEDFSKYHPPEILPNGDIILRRKTPAEIADTPEGEIEL